MKTKKKLKPEVNDKNGCHSILIYDKNLEKPKGYYCHRFVYEAIKGEIPKDLEINHINEIKSDNRFKNFELVIHKENIELSRNKKIYSKNILTKEKQIFESLTKASLELQIAISTISEICNKKTKRRKTKSRKDGKEYTFKFLNQ